MSNGNNNVGAEHRNQLEMDLIGRINEVSMRIMDQLISGRTLREEEHTLFYNFHQYLCHLDHEEMSEDLVTAVGSCIFLLTLILVPDFLNGFEEIIIDIPMFQDVPKTGITPEQLKKVTSLLRRDRDKSGFEQPACTICLENFKKTGLVRQLPCKHNFHDACITTWLENNKTCPLCVKEIEVPNDDPLDNLAEENNNLAQEEETSRVSQNQRPSRKCKRRREDAFNNE
jgi:hypothetical protein